MTLVWRIETAQGGGPYGWNGVGFPYDRIHGTFDPARHPIPSASGLKDYIYEADARFGFLSLRHLVRWFNRRERQVLAKGNFYVVLYNVRGEVDGDEFQCAFVLERATKLRQRRLYRGARWF